MIGGGVATKKYEYWNERVIQKNSTGAYTITVPVNMIRSLRWKQGQRVVFDEKSDYIVIKDAPKR